MNRVNLIPISRRRAKARRARMRAWMVLNSVYFAVLLVVGGATIFLLNSGRTPAAQLAKTNDDIEKSGKQLILVRQQLAEAQQTMSSVKAASEQPDWSVLMAVVAQSMGDNIVLSRCDLAPVKEESAPVQVLGVVAKPAAAPQPSNHRVLLHLSGIGRSQAQVAQFVLRLEATDLFEHVNLLHTSRQVFIGNEAVSFELDCPLAGRIGGTQ